MTSAPRGMEAKDITRIKWIGDAQISPDGTRVAFVVTTLSEEKDEYSANIWIVDRSGGTPRRFTTGPKRDGSPRWSPDGKQLAFISEREDKKRPQLYVMPANGGEPVKITDIKRGVGNPVWSPDSSRIAVLSKTGGWDEPEDEKERGKSKPARVISTLKYKMNGEGFVHDRFSHIFVVPADGSEPPKQITDGESNDGGPAWSPDGQFIAFSSARHDNRDFDNASDIFVAPAAGGDLRQVTDTSGPVGSPAWSPDGGTIAYLGHRTINEAGRNVRVWTVPAGGGAARCLTEGLDRTCAPFFGGESLTWSADGATLTFSLEADGDVGVYRVAADGAGAPYPVLSGERTIAGYSMSKDGSAIAFAASDPTNPAEVFTANGDGTGERRLTDLNATWKTDVTLSAAERFRFDRDGFTIDCWVMKPWNFEESKRYPAILNVHGGPATQYGHTFFDEFQVQCGAGYVVVFCNPRGSQGYGEDFTRAVVGDWGGGDYADVMMAMDEALRRCDFIDSERIGIQGGSYGGFMTSWTVAHTDRFTAACSERALNTFISMYGSSDIGHSFPDMYSAAPPPFEDLDWYIKHSPLSYATNITTPLLIMHSEDDLRCPMEQAEQLFVVLKKLRREVLFIRFPDESHELSRTGRPRHRLERFGHILDWFAKYLHPADVNVAEAVAAD